MRALAAGPGRSFEWAPTLRGARVAIKQHRIEVVGAVIAAVVVGISALIVTWRLNSVPMPAGCFGAWLSAPGAPLAPDCDAAIRLWKSIRDDEAAWVLRALAILPLAGLLAGVPIVGRELELRTAQTAWSLAGSRRAWLLRQAVPVLLAVGVATSFAAFAADGLDATQPHSEVLYLPFHGPILVARTLVALGVGLLAGALLGRTLPAFFVGLVVCFGLAAAAEPIRFAWLDTQKTIVGELSSAYPYSFGVYLRAPDGTFYPLDSEVAATLAPPGVQEPETWLYDHGYTLAELAVTDEAARGWIPYEAALWAAAGIASLAATALLIDRRRPA
ncbi:MAG TPA: hypothetical protein VGK63_06825 [Candidatus Limnocylindrales bacterium]